LVYAIIKIAKPEEFMVKLVIVPMKNVLSISGVILFSVVFFLFHSCADKPSPPVVATIPVSLVTYTTASSGGAVTNEGGAPVTGRGLCWNTSTDPTIINSKSEESGGFGAFRSNITQLTGGTKYYLRAYATNEAGTGYGNQITFTTRQSVTASITTLAGILITQTSAVSGGNISSENGAAVTARGVCWSISALPTVELSTKTTDGTGTGAFTSNLVKLIPNTMYYVRAYAISSAGTGYGDQVTLTTSQVTTASLTTADINSITQVSAVSGGIITNDNGATVTSRGVCWSTSTGPTIEPGAKTTDGSGTGVFASSITGLSRGVLYYVRAYATNSIGTSYGNQLSFTTLNVPSVTTTAVSSIIQTGATSGGNVTSDGGSVITDRGICWGSKPNPTITDSKTISGTGTGIFESSITGSLTDSVYYVRAYATNSIGTGYGNQVRFFITAGGKTGSVYNGHFYYIPLKNLSWMEAKTYSESLGGHLVIINDAAENNFVWNFCNREGFRIGLSDLEEEQVWKWVDGTLCRKIVWKSDNPICAAKKINWFDAGCTILTDFGYNNWKNGEPNNCSGMVNGICSENESYAQFNTDGTWNDGSGFGKFIIEWEYVPDVEFMKELMRE
jgi:hypothetical protein